MQSSRQIMRFISPLRLSRFSLLRKSVQAAPVVVLKNNCSTDALLSPSHEGMEKNYPEKIHQIVGDISKLTLLEVSDLNELLKKTLNIQDTPMMAMGAMSAAAAPVEEEEEVATKKEKTSFTVKLIKFDASKKIQIIKEIKNLVAGMNLVQAKKFVESTPTNVKTDVGKDEAEQLKAALEAVGGEVELE
ncbi:large ribosomal subunit protein bL12m-like [Lineus longissimus]|uniref:large ribosomal subunit protein bL12m-like n=1 Tax=Lineus longissimus TaxID=88925 RepID=UPI002B4EE3AB